MHTLRSLPQSCANNAHQIKTVNATPVENPTLTHAAHTPRPKNLREHISTSAPWPAARKCFLPIFLRKLLFYSSDGWLKTDLFSKSSKEWWLGPFHCVLVQSLGRTTRSRPCRSDDLEASRCGSHRHLPHQITTTRETAPGVNLRTSPASGSRKGLTQAGHTKN